MYVEQSGRAGRDGQCSAHNKSCHGGGCESATMQQLAGVWTDKTLFLH